MEKKDERITEAEAFVRKALSHFHDRRADEAAIKAAAVKVSKALPAHPETEAVPA